MFVQGQTLHCVVWPTFTIAAIMSDAFCECGRGALSRFLSVFLPQHWPDMFPFLSPPKPQFASWLIEQVETGQYTGLRYVDQNKFRVPWKHNSRKDCNDEDSKIFRVGPKGSVKFVTAILVLSDYMKRKMLMAVLTSVWHSNTVVFAKDWGKTFKNNIQESTFLIIGSYSKNMTMKNHVWLFYDITVRALMSARCCQGQF